MLSEHAISLFRGAKLSLSVRLNRGSKQFEHTNTHTFRATPQISL